MLIPPDISSRVVETSSDSGVCSPGATAVAAGRADRPNSPYLPVRLSGVRAAARHRRQACAPSAVPTRPEERPMTNVRTFSMELDVNAVTRVIDSGWVHKPQGD